MNQNKGKQTTLKQFADSTGTSKASKANDTELQRQHCWVDIREEKFCLSRRYGVSTSGGSERTCVYFELSIGPTLIFFPLTPIGSQVMHSDNHLRTLSFVESWRLKVERASEYFLRLVISSHITFEQRKDDQTNMCRKRRELCFLSKGERASFSRCTPRRAAHPESKQHTTK